MMHGGPADGGAPILGRAPVFLRAVRDAATGKIDYLDQLDDEPRENETVHVYMQRARTLAHVCARGRGRSGYVAEFDHLPGVDGEQLRDTEAWRAWCGAPEQDARVAAAG